MEIRHVGYSPDDADNIDNEEHISSLDRLSQWLSAPQTHLVILFGATLLTAGLLFLAASMSWQVSREARALSQRLDKIEKFEAKMRKAFSKAQSTIHASLLETDSKIERIGHSISRDRKANENFSKILSDLQFMMDDAIAERLQTSALIGAGSAGDELAITTHSKSFNPVSRTLRKTTTPKSRIKHGGSRLFDRVIRADGSVAYERKAQE